MGATDYVLKQRISRLIPAIHRAVEEAEEKSKLKQAEEALKESEKRFKKLSNLTFEGILIHDKGVTIDVNESLTRLLGYTRGEMIGKNVITLCVPREYHAKIKEKIVKHSAKPYEVMARKKDGTLFPVEIEARNVKDKDGKIRVTTIKDITERKQAEEEARKMHQNLVKAQKKLKRAYEGEKQLRDKLIQSEKLASLGQMGAKIAHGINNPLTVVSGRAEMGMDMDTSEKVKKSFSIIFKEAQRIKDITSTFMNLSKPTLPKEELLDLNEVVEECVEDLKTAGVIKHYKVNKNLQSDLPEITGDCDRLIQVFRNLIVNASHAMADC